MVDLHHHLVFGVDDGAQTMEDSVAMLRAAYEQGVTAIVCTSHSIGLNKEAYLKHFEVLKNMCAQEFPDMTLKRGMEILCTPDTASMLQSGELLPLGDTQNVLVEFDPNVPFQVLHIALQELSEGGFRPVLAHTERYACMRKDKNMDLIREETQALFQMNADTVIDCDRFFGDKWVKKMLLEDKIDVIASDAHGISMRACRMKDARKIIEKRFGVERAERLFETTPRELAGL